jgi:hypothetical protein
MKPGVAIAVLVGVTLGLFDLLLLAGIVLWLAGDLTITVH